MNLYDFIEKMDKKQAELVKENEELRQKLAHKIEECNDMMDIMVLTKKMVDGVIEGTKGHGSPSYTSAKLGTCSNLLDNCVNYNLIFPK
jgi:peroxiredoxin family protein